MRVDLQRDVRVGVPELAGHEDDVQPLRDQQRGVAVAEGVQREPSAGGDAAASDGRAKGFADIAVVGWALKTFTRERLLSRR